MTNGQSVVPRIVTALTTTNFATTNTTTGAQIPGLVAHMTLRRSWRRMFGRPIVAEIRLPACVNNTNGGAWAAVIYIDQIDADHQIVAATGTTDTAERPAYARSRTLHRNEVNDGEHTFYAYLKAVTAGTAEMTVDTANPGELTIREVA